MSCGNCFKWFSKKFFGWSEIEFKISNKNQAMTINPGEDVTFEIELPKNNTFVCDECDGTFDKDWDDEEALAELKKNFPGADVSDCGMVCDDCYEELTGFDGSCKQ